MIPQKIALIGYMGVGKSTIGKLLANELNKAFKDLDHEIEERENQSIKSIFQEKGEVYFRKKEHQILLEMLENSIEFVLSTGGGTPMYFNNMALLNEKSFTIYLQANISTLSERLWIEKDNRPLIAHMESKEQLSEFIAKHLFERESVYNTAHLKIKINQKSPEEIVNEIKTHLPHQ